VKNGSEDGVASNFTNVPEQVPSVKLRKGFEVCGMLINVFLSHKKNMPGQNYGFVKCVG